MTKTRRTIVLSDVHGFPELVHNALAHSGFDLAADALVFAGDFMDRGPDAEGCLRALRTAGAVMLLGNHDASVLLDVWISDHDPDNDRLRPEITAGVLGTSGDERWFLAHASEDVLITHAGVSAVWQREFDEECGRDSALMAGLLNRRLVSAVTVALETGGFDFEVDRILGDAGPLWYRYTEGESIPPLEGCPQVFGHTPVEMLKRSDTSLQRMDLFSIDPFIYGLSETNPPAPGRCKYAVIEEGEVRVVDVAPRTRRPLRLSRHRRGD